MLNCIRHQLHSEKPVGRVTRVYNNQLIELPKTKEYHILKIAKPVEIVMCR